MNTGILIKANMYEETYYTKNDTQRRYPRKAKRIRLDYPYNPEMNEALKRELRNVDGFYNVKYTDGSWNVRFDREVLQVTSSICERFGFNATPLEEFIASAPSVNTTTASKCSAYIVEGALALEWPFIRDSTLRDEVKNVVKGIPNRKWDNDNKRWMIPMKQAGFLVKRLEDVYEPLATVVSELEEVQMYIEKHAERVLISSAVELTNTHTLEDMKKRLKDTFHEGQELYPFQYVGVRFAELAGGRCLIGDDMGIGKTMQAIAYASLHRELWPVLVVCPSSVKYNWAKEIDTWLKDVSVEIVNGFKGEIAKADFTIVNYDLMAQREEQLTSMGFNLCVFDESHYLKNKKAKRTQACLNMGKLSQSVLCLSGTAITSRPEEYFTTLNLMRPIDFPNWLKYVQRYCAAYHDGFGWKTDGSSNEQELHQVTRDFVIRRLKKEVMSELPDKIRQEFSVEPSSAGLKSYQTLQSGWLDDYRQHKQNNTLPAGFVLNMLTSLRHHCGMLKVKSAVEWVTNYHATTNKPVVVYTHHKDVLSTVVSMLGDTLRVSVIEGGVSAKKRQEIIEDFQAGKVDVLVANILSANMGITLTAADTVVFVEREWTPAVEEQAEDRVNRIGQDANVVHAVYLRVSNTIDERFSRLVSQKRDVVKGILDGGEPEQRKKIATELLMSMIHAGELPASMLSDLVGKGPFPYNGTTVEW
tara:strand:- start:4247 stop:6343 length:2097 start_codon:yes stop_codon:yes gene_type:complete